MNRSTNILGFAFLALAVTMAASITMHHSPAKQKVAGKAGVPAADSRGLRPATSPADHSRRSARSSGIREAAADSSRVSLPETWLASLSPDERKTWTDRVAAVKAGADEQLARLTAQLDLSPSQQKRLFPVLVRSMPGYDAAMMVGGAVASPETSLTPAEEIHALLEQDQQALVEDREVNRQLWWQDIIEKLEKDLTNATGGPSDGNPPETPNNLPPGAVDEERIAPGARDNGNLFELLDPGR
ncbi:MAG: hypothetical protein K9N23_15370 [Akkermansiaceae bacterium]|nr:hypothetical protein [Akkermansiaceae bacterium]